MIGVDQVAIEVAVVAAGLVAIKDLGGVGRAVDAVVIEINAKLQFCSGDFSVCERVGCLIGDAVEVEVSGEDLSVVVVG